MNKKTNSTPMLTIAVCLIFSLGLSGTTNAQLVFDINDLDGSMTQPSILDATSLIYGMQKFTVTADLVNADAIEYHSAFTTNFVDASHGNQTFLDVRTWQTANIYLSTAADALNGTPTALAFFNPLESTAANGMQFQDLIMEETGPTGSIHHTFIPVTDLGTSSNNNPFHQLTTSFSMDTTLSMQDNSTTTLADFLSEHAGQTLYISSIIRNAATNGIYRVAGGANFGQDGIIYGPTGGFLLEDIGFAHIIEAVTVDEPVLGDVNLDGDVDFFDISPFIALLTANGFQDEADLDQNGAVDFFDISPFITALSSQ